MDPLSLTASVASLTSVVLQFYFDFYFVRPISYVRLYGISGVVVAAFGSKNVWDIQAEVLGSRNDETAMAFRKSVQDESTTCAVAVIEPYILSVNNWLMLVECYRFTNCHYSVVASISQPSTLGSSRILDLQSHLRHHGSLLRKYTASKYGTPLTPWPSQRMD